MVHFKTCIQELLIYARSLYILVLTDFPALVLITFRKNIGIIQLNISGMYPCVHNYIRIYVYMKYIYKYNVASKYAFTELIFSFLQKLTCWLLMRGKLVIEKIKNNPRKMQFIKPHHHNPLILVIILLLF